MYEEPGVYDVRAEGRMTTTDQLTIAVATATCVVSVQEEIGGLELTGPEAVPLHR